MPDSITPAEGFLPDGKPVGHVNVGGTARWAIRQTLGGKKGQAVIDLIEHLTPDDLEKMAGKVAPLASLIRGRL